MIVVVAFKGGTIPLTSVVLLAAIYGLQAIIFLLNQRFDMIGWMFLYILALPLWSLILPLYSFWRMDDFSWGNTRVVMDEHGQKLLVHHEGAFDPAEIPHMTWEEYENQLWNHGDTQRTEPMSLWRAPSLYGQATVPVPEYSAPSVMAHAAPLEGHVYSDVPSMTGSQYMPLEEPADAPLVDPFGANAKHASVHWPGEKRDSMDDMSDTERWPSIGLPPDAVIRRDIRRRACKLLTSGC